ncbi:META domain-containing protein [Candidatus Electrothrix sp.]|uniref:META domain-containing protein n=1 Tax=Candidatus Electrothrix sp. TaxID=2170559 RepID=UPI0040574000
MQRKKPLNAPVQAEIGAWSYNKEKNIVRLLSYDRALRVLAVTGKKTLKLIKVSGGMMPPLLRYNFTLTNTEPGYQGVVRMQGMYSRKRGRGIFRECLSGASFPLVSKMGGLAEVEQAYQNILHGRSEPLFVTLDMRVSAHAGRGDRLIPVYSVNIDPYRSCTGKARRIATIANNRWYLIEVGGKTLAPESVSRPPFLKVQSGEQLIQGFAGCNNFTGSWLFADNDFVFSRITSTRMACPLGMEVEDAFLQALDNTRRYNIRGDILSLYDRRGKVLARLRYSRQLTDLDFRYPSPEQGDILSDDIELSRSHSVATGGSVPASVSFAPEKQNIEKKLPLPEESGHEHSDPRKISVLKPTKKVAVGGRTGQSAEAMSSTSAPKTPEPTGENKQEDKGDTPPVASGDEDKMTGDKEAENPSAVRAEQSSATQSNQEEEATASIASSQLTSKNGQEVQQAASVPEAVEKESAGEVSKQPMVQDSEEKEVEPPPIPESEIPEPDISETDSIETDEDEQELQSDPTTTHEIGDQAANPDISSDDAVPPESQDDGEKVLGENVQAESASPGPEAREAVQAFPVSESSCNQPWKTPPLAEINGQVRKVEMNSPSWTNQRGLQLDVQTSAGTYVVHVFPENLMAQCQEVLHFEVGEKIVVSGSEFRTGKGQGQLNICAATITKGSNVLRLRDPLTSTLDKRLCCQEMCRERCVGKPEQCKGRCLARCNGM